MSHTLLLPCEFFTRKTILIDEEGYDKQIGVYGQEVCLQHKLLASDFIGLYFRKKVKKKLTFFLKYVKMDLLENS